MTTVKKFRCMKKSLNRITVELLLLYRIIIYCYYTVVAIIVVIIQNYCRNRCQNNWVLGQNDASALVGGNRATHLQDSVISIDTPRIAAICQLHGETFRATCHVGKVGLVVVVVVVVFWWQQLNMARKTKRMHMKNRDGCDWESRKMKRQYRWRRERNSWSCPIWICASLAF